MHVAEISIEFISRLMLDSGVFADEQCHEHTQLRFAPLYDLVHQLKATQGQVGCSWVMPRYGRPQLRKSDQNPSMVAQCLKFVVGRNWCICIPSASMQPPSFARDGLENGEELRSSSARIDALHTALHCATCVALPSRERHLFQRRDRFTTTGLFSPVGVWRCGDHCDHGA